METKHLRTRFALALISGCVVIAPALSGCGGEPEASDAPTGERTIHLQATEQDAHRSTDDDPFPTETVEAFPSYFGDGEDPFARAGLEGYYLLMTDEAEWRIGSYLFLPQEILAYEGEELTLEIFGVRGDEHGTILRGPDGEVVESTDGEPIDFVVDRGELETVTFVADRPGLYRLVCHDHPPTMTTNIHVLPR